MSERTLFEKDRRPIHERFREFHEANPEVFRLFIKFALTAKRAGMKRYSADAILHRIRWHCNVDVVGAKEFKISDHYSAYYARLAMETYPVELDGFFETRKRKSA